MRLIILLLVLTTLNCKAQNSRIIYGYYLELIQRQNSLKTSPSPFSRSLVNENRIGFGLGTSILFNQAELLSIRTSPGLSFEEELISGSKRGTISFKLPVHVLWRFSKSTNFRLVTGVTPIFGLIGGKDRNNDLNFKQFDFTGDVGLNYRIKTGRMFLTPEFKYSKSFVDGKSNSNSKYQIDSYMRNKFVLTIILTR